MDWTALQTALKAWVLALLGWSATRDVVIFENEPWKRDNRRVQSEKPFPLQTVMAHS